MGVGCPSYHFAPKRRRKKKKKKKREENPVPAHPELFFLRSGGNSWNPKKDRAGTSAPCTEAGRSRVKKKGGKEKALFVSGSKRKETKL